MLLQDRIRFYRQNGHLRVDDVSRLPGVADAASIYGDQAAIAGRSFGPAPAPAAAPGGGT